MRLRIIVLLCVATVLLVSACVPIQDPAAMQSDAEPAQPSTTVESISDVPRISVDEAKQHFDAGSAVFVDARGEDEYEQAHIAGAIRLPDAPIESLVDTLPKDQLIITYCT